METTCKVSCLILESYVSHTIGSLNFFGRQAPVTPDFVTPVDVAAIKLSKPTKAPKATVRSASITSCLLAPWAPVSFLGYLCYVSNSLRHFLSNLKCSRDVARGTSRPLYFVFVLAASFLLLRKCIRNSAEILGREQMEPRTSHFTEYIKDLTLQYLQEHARNATR